MPVRANDGKIAGAIVVVQDISQQKITEQELRRINDHLDALVQARTAAAERKTEQLRSLTAQLVEVEENERRNFAALLHDDLQQIIGAAQVQIQTLVRTLPDAPLLADVDRLLQSAIGKTRYLSGEMSPPVLRHADLAAGLRWLAARKKERFQLVVTIDMVGEPQISNLAMKQFIFRSAQELLYNIPESVKS